MIFQAVVGGGYIEKMSDEEFFHFCQENRDIKFERTPSGKIEIMSPTFFKTGDQNSEIIMQLRIWNKKARLGRVVDSDTGFFLANHSMRNPDCAWVSNERLNELAPEELEGFPHVCPDFVIELKSGSDRLSELKKKMAEWMANGCRLGWLIDADDEVVYIFEGETDRIHRNFDLPLSGSPVLPGFELVLSELRV